MEVLPPKIDKGSARQIDYRYVVPRRFYVVPRIIQFIRPGSK